MGWPYLVEGRQRQKHIGFGRGGGAPSSNLKKNRWAVAAFDGSDGEGERTPQHCPPAQGKLVYGGTRKLAALRPRGRL